MQFLDNNDRQAFQPKAEMACTPADFAAAGTAETDAAYAADASRAFAALKYAASLVTGTLLLDLTGSDRTVQDRALTEKARGALEEARASIAGLKPVSDNALHHRHHLRRAGSFLNEAVRLGERKSDLVRGEDSEAVFKTVQAGWDELKKLDALIAGFHTVDLGQGCCAYHAQRMAQLRQ